MLKKLPDPDRPMIAAFIEAKSLSDGSIAYDVIVKRMVLPAITERDAHDLALKIVHAIHAHTNEEVDYLPIHGVRAA